MSFPNDLSDEFLLHALMESTADSIYFKDRECRLLRVSRKMAKDLGFSDPAELIGKTDIDLFGEAFGDGTRLDDIRIMDMDRPIIGVIESRQMEDGRTNWTLTTKLPLHDESGAVIGLVGITREINEIRQTEVALQHLATHDTLTDLPNRFLMVDRIDQLLARSKRSATDFAVLFMDIDRFKEVNEHPDAASHGWPFPGRCFRSPALWSLGWWRSLRRRGCGPRPPFLNARTCLNRRQVAALSPADSQVPAVHPALEESSGRTV